MGPTNRLHSKEMEIYHKKGSTKKQVILSFMTIS